MGKRFELEQQKTKYSIASFAIVAALLAANPTVVGAEEVEENANDSNENHELLVDTIDEQDVSIDEEAARQRGEKVAQKEGEVVEQEDVIADAQEEVDQNQANVDEIAEEIEDVETEAEEIEQEIDQLEEDQASIDELEESIVEGEAQVPELEAEIVEVEEEQADAQSAVDEAQTEVETAREQVVAEEEELARLQEERDRLVAETDSTTVDANEIVLPAGYIESLENYSQIERPTEADNATMAEVALTGVELNEYVPTAEDEEVIIEDATNLDNETAIELAQFTAGLLNPVRRAFGNDELTPNQSAIDMANDIADRYEQDSHNPFEQGGHHNQGIEEVAGQYGLLEGQYYENLGTTSLEFGTRLSDLKRNVYDMLVLMLFDDAHANYGHSLSLAGEMNDGVDGFLGVSFSEVPAQAGSNDAYNTHIISVPNSETYLLDTTQFDPSANLPFIDSDHTEAIQTLDNQITTQQDTVNSAQANLNEAQDLFEVAENNLANINRHLNEVQAELDAVNTRLETDSARLNELQNADTLITELEEQLAEKQEELDALYGVYATAQADLDVSQTNLENEQATLAQLLLELEELKQEPYSRELERTEDIAFDTELSYNPDLLVGTEEVSRAGADGILWLLGNVTYIGDEVVNRLVLLSEILTEPISEIVQVGTQVAEIEDIATPNEEVETDEVIEDEPVTEEREEVAEVAEVAEDGAVKETESPVSKQGLPATGEAGTLLTTAIGLLFTTVGGALRLKKED